MNHIVFNSCEAVLWIGFGCALFIATAKSALKQLNVLYVAAITFVVFGVSDIIEIYTGAWWQPLWLLIMKVSCIVSFILCFISYKQNTRNKR